MFDLHWKYFAAGAFLCVAAPGHAAVIRVPEDQPSILAAVDLAVSGDSVLVGPGTWTDRETRAVQVGPNFLNIASCAFLKPGISVIGLGGPEATIVDGGPLTGASVVTFLHAQAGGEVTRLQGLTITGGGDGVIVVDATGMEIEDCRLLNNVKYGVGFGNTDLWMSDCLVKGNVISEAVFAAIEGSDGANLEMVNCRVEANVRGALRHHAGGSQWVILEDCEFIDHPAYGGVRISQVSNLQVRSTRFARNVIGGVALGGGLSVIQCIGAIEFCVFDHDSSTQGGGGLYVKDSDMRVENNTFCACHGGNPSSVHLGTGFTGSFARNVVSGSTGGAALRSVEPLGQDSGCNVLWDNEGGDFYGEWNPGLPEILADPQFCDAESGDFTVHDSSPCLAKNSGGCGDIGALGLGCGIVSVESRSWGRVKVLYRR
jgi:hypothetical protein